MRLATETQRRSAALFSRQGLRPLLLLLILGSAADARSHGNAALWSFPPTELCASVPLGPFQAPKDKPKAEVQATIKKVGSTAPDWFAATPLNFPKSLDLTWSDPPPGSPWDPSKNVSQFIWTRQSSRRRIEAPSTSCRQ